MANIPLNLRAKNSASLFLHGLTDALGLLIKFGGRGLVVSVVQLIKPLLRY